MPTLDETRTWIRDLFTGLVDKAGRPYHEHCDRVEAGLGPNVGDDERHAALLHDVIEDCGITAADLSARGYSARTIMLVGWLTTPPSIGYQDHIRSIATTRDAGLIRIKLADNADNSDPDRLAMVPAHAARLTAKYAEARAILLPALQVALGRTD